MDSAQRREDLLGNDYDVRFYVVPVDGLRIELVAPSGASWATATGGDFMQHYRLVGDAAARSLLNRLSPPGEDSNSILGTLAPLAPVTLSPEAKKAAMIPAGAAFFSFAYPLDSLDASSKTLIETIIGSVSRLDDELFFFFLLGGFCYFDEHQGFLQANAISLKKQGKGIGELRFDGPYPLNPGAADVLQASSRLRPLHLLALNEVGLVKLGWCNPLESPDGQALHDSIEWKHGAFVYERSDGQHVFYRTTPRGATGGASGTARVRILARGWQREHTGFLRLQTRFENSLEKSRQLRMSLDRRKRGPVERWLRWNGVMIALYYGIGAVFFHYVELWPVFDCLYFMTVTATTVGYGDLAPVTPLGRALSTVYMPFGTIVSVSSAGEGIELGVARGCARSTTDN